MSEEKENIHQPADADENYATKFVSSRERRERKDSKETKKGSTRGQRQMRIPLIATRETVQRRLKAARRARKLTGEKCASELLHGPWRDFIFSSWLPAARLTFHASRIMV